MTASQEKPIVRIAPSPTGFLHIGTARTALYNFLFAKKHGGKFLVRIEDTDKERSKEEYEKDILEGLSWLGITYDDLYRQSERTEIYKKHLNAMVANGSAYISKEPQKDDPTKEVEVVRFKNPNKKIVFNDLIRGDIEFDTTDLKDFVIARDMESPLYHLAVAVDDFEMGVTHIIRGEDHISNTPRQILIQEAIGAKRPLYAHIPLILAPDRSKMSKRHGATSVNEYKARGYLSEAIVNFIAMIGWNPGGEQELFSLEELVEHFDIAKVQKGGAVFNIEKLNWFNKEYIKKAIENKEGDVIEWMKKYVPSDIKLLPSYSDEIFRKVVPVVLERISSFSEITGMADDMSFYFTAPKLDPKKLIWKDSTSEETKKILEQIIKLLGKADFSAPEGVKSSVWDFAEEKGRGAVLWPMRFAVSGRDKSPDPFTIASIIGKEETLARLEHAFSVLK